MANRDSSTIHLVLALHETQHYRQRGRTWLERLTIRIGLVPPYPEDKEIGSVWAVLPGQSPDDYESGTEITGPLPGPKARHVFDRLRTTFERLGFTVVVETDHP